MIYVLLYIITYNIKYPSGVGGGVHTPPLWVRHEGVSTLPQIFIIFFVRCFLLCVSI